jgi:HSP20 family protein
MLGKWFTFDDMLYGSLKDIPCDVFENDKEFELDVDLPGVNPEEIDVKVEENKLFIKAERKWSKSRGSFSRSFLETFLIPQLTDSGNISATYSCGVLRVVIPKQQSAPVARKIEVKKV